MKLFDFDYFFSSIPQLLEYVPTTLFITLFSFTLALIVGLGFAMARIYNVPVLKRLVQFYITVVRGTPMIIQLFLICYGIPKLLYFCKVQYGLFAGYTPNSVAPIVFAIIAFSINLTAYLAEMVRASLETVGSGQFEAAYAAGMTRIQAMRRIVIPQALCAAIPTTGTWLISTVKDTSFVFTIGIIDMMGAATVIGAREMAHFEVYIAVALLYWAICWLMERLFIYLEKRVRRFEKRIA